MDSSREEHPMPTKKDYLHVAAIFYEERASVRTIRDTAPEVYAPAYEMLRSLEVRLCEYFYNDNPRFDREKFLLASGARAEEDKDA